MIINVPVTGNVRAVRTSARGKTVLSAEPDSVVAPVGLQDMCAFVGRAPSAPVASRVLSWDIERGTARIEITGDDAWIADLSAFIQGMSVDDLRSAVRKIDRTSFLAEGTPADYATAFNAMAEPDPTRFPVVRITEAKRG